MSDKKMINSYFNKEDYTKENEQLFGLLMVLLPTITCIGVVILHIVTR